MATTNDPAGVDVAQMTRAQRAALPISADVARALAEQHGVCIRPPAMRRINTSTGRIEVVPVACGSTREDQCRPCADKARRLRMAQCRQGWHLQDEPVTDRAAPSEDHTALMATRAAPSSCGVCRAVHRGPDASTISGLGCWGIGTRRKLERGPKATKRPYPLRGRIRCGYCGRRMEGTPRQERTYYRCTSRSLAPGSPVLDDHPKNVYLPERAVLALVNAWIGDLFDNEHRAATVEQLAAADSSTSDNARMEQTRNKLLDTEKRLRRLQPTTGDRGWREFSGSRRCAQQDRTGTAGSPR